MANERPTGLVLAGVLCLLAGGAASAEVWSQGRKPKSAAQYHTQDAQSGAYQYGYSGPHHAKSESSFNGVTRGGYSYIDANGLMQTVSYTADAENGFRVQASNLPNGNSLAPVQDTPEVAVAKKRHLEQLRKADSDSWQEPQKVDHIYLNSDDGLEDSKKRYPEQPRSIDSESWQDRQKTEYAYLSSENNDDGSDVYRPVMQQQQQQYRPRQYRPSQYRRQQQLQPEDQQLQQQYQPQQQQYQPRQRARQVSNTRSSSYLLSPEEARDIPAPLPSTTNAIVVEAAKPALEPVPVPTRFSTASASVHQHHLIVPAMFAVPMPLVHSSMRHTQDSLGQYEYSYTGDTSAKTESRSLDGTTRGAYSYIDAHGILQQVHYIADKDGFRVLATNLPQA